MVRVDVLDFDVRLLKEFRAGKRYDHPYRVIVHQVIGYTLQDYFVRRPGDLPLPETWELAATDDPEATRDYKPG